MSAIRLISRNNGRRAQHHGLHHGVVAAEHAVDDHLAEARDGEDLLRQYRARQQLAKLQCAQRHHRDQRRSRSA